MTTTDFGDLSTTDLAKLINDEYAVILDNERTNLQKALAVGEKLKALRPRIAPDHGEWQTKLKLYCPKLSYETATLYIRLFDKRDDLEKAAATKHATVTDLTIRDARDLLAKPKPAKSAGTVKPAKVVKSAVEEPGNEPPSSSVTLESFLENTAPDELFATLKDKYEPDQLRALAKLLVDHLTNVREQKAA